jgi:hypothetical protein
MFESVFRMIRRADYSRVTLTIKLADFVGEICLIDSVSRAIQRLISLSSDRSQELNYRTTRVSFTSKFDQLIRDDFIVH